MTFKVFLRKSETFLKALLKRFNEAEVVNNSIVLAYYLLLSFFPLVMLLGTLLPLFQIRVNTVLEYIETAVPETIYNITEPIVKDFLGSGNGELFSFSLVMTVFSASQAVAAFQRTVNRAYGVAKYQNPIINRVVSFFLTVVIIAIMAVLVFLFSFGQTLVSYLTPILNLPTHLFALVGQLKWPVTIVGLFVGLSLLYYLVPNAKIRFKYVIPGTVFATVGTMVLSQVFSFYLRIFARSVTSYKTLGTFIAIMFWLNFSAMIIMFGGVLNATWQELREGKIIETAGSLRKVVGKYKINIHK
ncbi:YihY family inner membrane protein [Pediococcus acidilactici]|uniref:YihY/virulence factor BrkB family protein n=1 Tax=Pediococcus acidilactici TaxID=1254 RepID=UPI00132C0109|nr:YihY/virulence factor BrkB family protein [Pediococcus acidilactici]KAF0363632.1 YihY family inner membrane protein [Pediococcus acidilactici]KAF0367388.1 YihY family inner membrane protein [Pediococcus acidilactici]KAF0417933.1 YihY family inner membrane protein [Pediococcus acidilactici]KAF0421221.1 YihY family inner membrane protein [Pediococcus acidilactici]KAF0473890.1 YihY family inner membrane protein [Pediococcus acidilactici]